MEAPSGSNAQKLPETNDDSSDQVSEISDDALVHSAQKGDQDAFALLIQRHQGAVYGYLRARLLEPSDAEDLSQEVFIRSYQAKATFDHPGMVRPWLLGIARNLLREHARRMKRRKEILWTSICIELEDQKNEPDESIYDDVSTHLAECVETLGENAQQALDWRYRAKLRLIQIGEKLGRTEGAVKLLLFRARQALKICLERKSRDDQNE